MAEDANSNRIEGVKIVYDYLKHLTTLSAGSIVVLATFWGRNPPPAQPTKLVTASLICFVICITLNTLAAGIYAGKAEQGDFSVVKGVEKLAFIFAFAIAMFAFIAAMFCLAIFAIQIYT